MAANPYIEAMEAEDDFRGEDEFEGVETIELLGGMVTCVGLSDSGTSVSVKPVEVYGECQYAEVTREDAPGVSRLVELADDD